MDKTQIIHDLSVAFAQVCLADFRKEHPESIGCEEETEFFIKSYLRRKNDIYDVYDDAEIDF